MVLRTGVNSTLGDQESHASNLASVWQIPAMGMLKNDLMKSIHKVARPGQPVVRALPPTWCPKRSRAH